MLNVTVKAHEFWLEPSDYNPQTGTSIGITLLVGQNFEGNPQPFIQSNINDFRILTKKNQFRISGRMGDSRPAANVVITEGLSQITHLTEAFSIEFTNQEKWDNYIASDGLEAQIKRPKSRQKVPITERYIRSAKTLILSSDTSEVFKDKPTGLPFELILTSPTDQWTKGSHLFTLNLHGNPISGVLVKAFSHKKKLMVSKAITNQLGEARLQLPTDDVYLISGVHIEPDPQSKSDWKSFWASLTLSIKKKMQTD